MATPSDISVGLAHELSITATKVGWEPKDFSDLAHSENKARQVLSYLRGFSEMRPIPHLIDCDAAPFIPDGWQVEEHRKGGQFKFDPAMVKLYLSKGQRGGKRIEGAKLRTELAKKSVLNANVLDYLRKPENRRLIPAEWKDKYIYFWGTIYRGPDGSLFVRCLYCFDGRCSWHYIWLGLDWLSSSPAAVRA